MKKLSSVLSLVALVAASAGVAAPARPPDGHGAAAFHGRAPHAVGGRAFRGDSHMGREAFHGHPGFHRHGHGGVFVGVAPVFPWWDPYPVPVYAPPVVEAPPVYTQPSGYW